MCLIRNKACEDLLLKKRNPNDWVIVWKVLGQYLDGLHTPYQVILITKQKIIAYPKEKKFPPLGHSFSTRERNNDKDIIRVGAIHAYKTEAIAQINKPSESKIFKAYTQVKDIVGVGESDVATRKLILDDKQWRQYHASTRQRIL